jgi:hypothetical protein
MCILGHICADTVADNKVGISRSIFKVNLSLTLDSGRVKMSQNTLGIIVLQFLWPRTLLDITRYILLNVIVRFYLAS